MMSIDVTGEQWARRVQRLSKDERAQRTEAVRVLLDKPDEISDPLESELYVLLDQLTGEHR